MMSGAIVYCATRKQTEEVADFLISEGICCNAVSRKAQTRTKKTIQEDLYLANHESLLRPTRSAWVSINLMRWLSMPTYPDLWKTTAYKRLGGGRDREAARCVLLYNIDDVERQFNMAAHSHLPQHEIALILKR